MITFKDFRSKINNILLSIYEESTFYIYRTDTKTVLARGINGFDAARQEQAKSVKHTTSSGIRSSSSLSVVYKALQAFLRSLLDVAQSGVSNSSKTFRDASGKRQCLITQVITTQVNEGASGVFGMHQVTSMIST